MKDSEKLIQKFLTGKMRITVEDCDRLLVAYGFEYRKSSGSHRAYHQQGERPIVVITPQNTRYVKPEYVRLIVKRLNLES